MQRNNKKKHNTPTCYMFYIINYIQPIPRLKVGKMRTKPLQTIPTIKRKLSLPRGKAIGDPIIRNRNGHEHHH